MTTFNTNTAQTLAAKQMFTSLDVVKNMLHLLEDESVKGLRNNLKCQDMQAIADMANRHGCYQVFGNELQLKIRVNGYSFTIIRLPVIDKVTFQLVNKDGFSKWTTKAGLVESFLLDIVSDKAVISMLNK